LRRAPERVVRRFVQLRDLRELDFVPSDGNLGVCTSNKETYSRPTLPGNRLSGGAGTFYRHGGFASCEYHLRQTSRISNGPICNGLLHSFLLLLA
jgi:hypothetical protein